MVVTPADAALPAPVRPGVVLLRLAVTIGLILVVAAVVWWFTRPSLESVLAENHIDPATVVALDDETRVSVSPMSGHGVRMFILDYDLTDGWDVGGAAAGDDIDDGADIGMIGAGGEDTLNWSSMLFGIGPEGTAGIEVTTPNAVGVIVDPRTGAFFVGSHDELGPDDLRYQLFDAEGTLVFEGRGLTATSVQRSDP